MSTSDTFAVNTSVSVLLLNIVNAGILSVVDYVYFVLLLL